MAGNHLIFDAYNISEIAPDHYDQHIYSYRYRNGVRAESISGFADTKRRLEHMLKDRPYTTDQLSRALSFDRHMLQKILDYLFTHTGDIAALDIPHQSTLYIWSDIQAAEKIKTKLSLGAVNINTEDYSTEDITAIISYLTNLLVLKPSVDILEAAIDKCRTLLDAARLAQAFQPSNEMEDRIALLKKKHDQLVSKLELEIERWAREEPDEADNEDAKSSSDLGIDSLPDVNTTITVYRYDILYLLGSKYKYTGRDRHTHLCIDDPELTILDFSRLKSLVVEIDTFIGDLENGASILGIVEGYMGTVFPSRNLHVTFRKVTGMKYNRTIERQIHEEVLNIRQLGYHVTEHR